MREQHVAAFRLTAQHGEQHGLGRVVERRREADGARTEVAPRPFERVEAGASTEEIDALRLDARLSTSNALLTGTRVTQTAFTACTTLALRNGNMIQRCFRDSQAGNAHILTGEASYIEVGRILVGIEGATQFF